MFYILMKCEALRDLTKNANINPGPFDRTDNTISRLRLPLPSTSPPRPSPPTRYVSEGYCTTYTS